MKKMNLIAVISLVGTIICILLFIGIFAFNDNKIIIGVLSRGVFSLLVMINGSYIVFTNKPSFLIRKGQEKYRRVVGVILLFVGLFAFITALMGYGINGYPLLDWKSILP